MKNLTKAVIISALFFTVANSLYAADGLYAYKISDNTHVIYEIGKFNTLRLSHHEDIKEGIINDNSVQESIIFYDYDKDRNVDRIEVLGNGKPLSVEKFAGEKIKNAFTILSFIVTEAKYTKVANFYRGAYMPKDIKGANDTFVASLGSYHYGAIIYPNKNNEKSKENEYYDIIFKPIENDNKLSNLIFLADTLFKMQSETPKNYADEIETEFSENIPHYFELFNKVGAL